MSCPGEPYPIEINSPHISNRGNEYLVTWNKPETGGRRITNYYIGYRRVFVQYLRYIMIYYVLFYGLVQKKTTKRCPPPSSGPDGLHGVVVSASNLSKYVSK